MAHDFAGRLVRGLQVSGVSADDPALPIQYDIERKIDPGPRCQIQRIRPLHRLHLAPRPDPIRVSQCIDIDRLTFDT